MYLGTLDGLPKWDLLFPFFLFHLTDYLRALSLLLPAACPVTRRRCAKPSRQATPRFSFDLA
jgi:hypothetical protein